MKTIKLNLKNRSYAIFIKDGLLKQVGKILHRLDIGQDAIIITNNTLSAKFGNIIKTSLIKTGFTTKFFFAPDSEKAKSIQCAFNLIDKISKYDKNKKVFIIALGGGVVGDLSGFIASIYKRGIPYVQIPTTLLAQIDSSIGGKTAIDLKIAKNLVGAFYQPKAVIADTSLLKSLPNRQLKSGLAEIIKYAVIKDGRLFTFLENNYRKIMNLDKKSIEFIEERCINIKARIVEKDEKEKKGIRTILNFGHTIGHAVESASGYEGYNHGEAVSIGMVCASEIAYMQGLLSKKELGKIINLINLYNLPTQIKRIPLMKIMNSLLRDKKFSGFKNKFVLPLGIGSVAVKTNIPIDIIKRVITKYSRG